MRDATLIWWDVTQSTLSPTVLAQLSWADFKRKLMEEFCSERSMDRIEKEFRSLVKGSLTVREYTRQFMEKLRLVGHVAPTEKDKMKAYLNGLPADLLSMIHNSKASNFREMVEKLNLWRNCSREARLRKLWWCLKRENGRAIPLPLRGLDRLSGTEVSTTTTKRLSGARVSGSSIVVAVTLLRDFAASVASGHMRRDCPKLKSGSAPEKRVNPSRVPGRAFQMTTDEAKASVDVVSGTFLLNSVPARVLFDSGASFSFISELFRRNIAMPTTSLEDALVVLMWWSAWIG
ncbi:hypothetical protein L6452_07105 [Arctium lappa]|uniref:Uncharacterized protein n=1 Tax=Arctium lappa TaxID=4217 RepID=A0ACB9EK27_ARCLA|nr:hypothetical protein L6452_07105 [Arctium lappa]